MSKNHVLVSIIMILSLLLVVMYLSWPKTPVIDEKSMNGAPPPDIIDVPIPKDQEGSRPPRKIEPISDGGEFNAVVTTSGVNLREGPTVTSNIVGSLRRNTDIKIIREEPVSSDHEAMLNRDTHVLEYGKLYKGYPVVIDNEYEDMYEVTFVDKHHISHSAILPKENVDLVSIYSWYYIKAADGSSGWVLSKFVRRSTIY